MLPLKTAFADKCFNMDKRIRSVTSNNADAKICSDQEYFFYVPDQHITDHSLNYLTYAPHKSNRETVAYSVFLLLLRLM